ncbi:MAG TPA: sigma-70 family RNA polymerase sigma factor [Acidimicrobiales bacterium]
MAAPDHEAWDEDGAEAFDDAFAALFACAYRAAYRLLGQRQEAEDVAIEAVARAHTRWSDVRGFAEPWVVRVATNVALDRVRRGAPPRLATASGSSSAVEHRVDLVRALRRLPRRQREVVLLRYVGDRPELEVAEVLGISAGSVKQHASRGLAALRKNLGDYPLMEAEDVR